MTSNSFAQQVDALVQPGKKDGGRLKRFLQDAIANQVIPSITGDMLIDSHLAYHGHSKLICQQCKTEFLPNKQFKQITNPLDYGCSTKCTTMLRHGFISPFEQAVVQLKKQETVRQRYGVTNVFQHEASKVKSRQTMLGAYGVEYAGQSKELQAKASLSYQARYGVPWVLSRSSPIRLKLEQHWHEKWGTKHPCGHPEVVAKANETRLTLYGHINQGFTTEAKQKALLTRRTDALAGCVAQLLKLGYEVAQPELPIDALLEKGEALVLLKHLRCGSISPCEVTCAGNLYTICKGCKFISKPERELFDFIKTLSPTVVQHDRTILKPFELDIVLHEQKLAIELDGVYWHRDQPGEGATYYHHKKTELCEQQGYQLLHIFDHEWDTQQELLKAMLLAKLGLAIKLQARKLKVVNVLPIDARAFLEHNHLQGFINAPTHLGLADMSGELIMLMSLGGKRFSRKGELEIYRQATKQGCVVIGGLEKLLAKTRQLFAGRLLVTFVDRRFFTGTSYLRAGFKLVDKTTPNYWYYKDEVLINRLGAKFSDLPALLGEAFDPLLTEQENMELAGWFKLSDCGNLKLEMTL